MGRHFFNSFLTINEGFKRCKEIFLTFGAFFLPGIIASPRVSGTEFNDPAFLLGSLIAGLTQIGLILYLIEFVGGRSKKNYGIGPLTRSAVLQGFFAFLGIVPILFLFLLLAGLVPENLLISSLPDFRWRYSNYAILPLVALTCLVTGYREELYFRSYLLTEFARFGISFPAALAAGVFLFGLGHLYQGISGFVAAALLGSYLSLVFRKTENLHVPAIAHGIYNFSVLILSGFF